MTFSKKAKVGLLAIVAGGGFLLSLTTPVLAGAISGEITNQGTGTGMANITVNLFTPAGDPLGTTSTDSNGNYSFSGLTGGGNTYLIQEVTPAGYYQTNPTFPNLNPTAQSTPGAFGNTTGTWNYNSNGGATPPPNWVTSGTPAPFESALNITGPTVNLGSTLGIHYTNTSSYNLLLKISAPGDPGYQIQATAFGTPESITVNGTPFNLSNIHFHSPTENTVNGAPPGLIEEHFVNASASGGEAVLAVFIQLGTQTNASLENLFGALANLGTAGGSTLPGSTVGELDFSSLLPSSLQGWFYPGSLTTPPLSTPVNWFVFQTPIEMTQQEFDEYQAYATAAQFFPNARPIQDPAGRVFNSLTTVTLNDADVTADIINAQAVPEPSTIASAGIAGLIGLAVAARKRQAKTTA